MVSQLINAYNSLSPELRGAIIGGLLGIMGAWLNHLLSLRRYKLEKK